MHQVKWALVAEVTVRGEEEGGGQILLLYAHIFFKKILVIRFGALVEVGKLTVLAWKKSSSLLVIRPPHPTKHSHSFMWGIQFILSTENPLGKAAAAVIHRWGGVYAEMSCPESHGPTFIALVQSYRLVLCSSGDLGFRSHERGGIKVCEPAPRWVVMEKI